MRRIPIAVLALLGPLAVAPAASAHTEADLVAVPAGSEATVTLAPTHGCGESPTVEVSTRVPVAGATAGAVEGWTATATDDGEGNTVLEWAGGVLPTDETGAFPLTFTAPDEVGTLLTFPFVQVCENGEELPWIDGDPEGEFPAPRLLVLPTGSEPAETIDEVPADAPGRDQLSAIVDVDNPAAGSTTTTTPTTAGATPTSTPDPTTPTTPTTTTTDAPEGDDGGSSFPWPAAGAVVVFAGLAGGFALRRRGDAR